MASRRLTGFICLAMLIAASMSERAAAAEPVFSRSQIRLPSSNIQYADINGDGLLDVLCVAEGGLYLFLQDKDKGFSDDRRVLHNLERKAAAFWVTHVNNEKRAAILTLTPDGLLGLRLDPDGRLQTDVLVATRTIVPCEDLDPKEDSFVIFPLSVWREGQMPLLLVPAEPGLEVWRHSADAGWQRDVSIAGAFQKTYRSPADPAAYAMYDYLNLVVADFNADGRDDLVIREPLADLQALRLRVHLQTADGRLSATPDRQVDLSCTHFEWIGLQDINGDGRCDLVKSTWAELPLIMPGVPSGKVIVRVFLAGQDGAWPAEPNYTLRKHDWTAPVQLVDLDGDGLLDLPLVYYQWKGRDELVETLETRQLTFDLRLHFFEKGRGYGPEPDVTDRIRAYYGPPRPHIDTDVFEVLYSLAGDFNGDGRADLAIRDGEDTIGIWFFRSRQEGFPKRPDVRLKVPYEAWRLDLEPVDLNGDGISDLVVQPWQRDKMTVFLSAKESARGRP